jgi:nucleoside-diphosphate-sugar epimerase
VTNILVTGGAGFIGSHIVRSLLECGEKVRVLDNFSSGKRENLEGLIGLDIHGADLRNSNAVKAAVQDMDTVFHLAAFVSVPLSLSDPESCFSINAGGTVALLEAARQSGVRKVVLASSTAVYGDAGNLPISEDTPLHPMSPYAVSKQVNELYARLYSQMMGLPVISLRFFNVYGPRQCPDSDYAAAIPIFLSRLLDGQPITIFGDGKQTRDFIYVNDVVQALQLASRSEAAGEEYNVCTGHETSLLDLLEELSGVTPRQTEVRFDAPRPGDINRSVGNPDKAAKAFGFHAQTSLAEGLSLTLEWMKTGNNHA